jgi:hypothetical protein
MAFNLNNLKKKIADGYRERFNAQSKISGVGIRVPYYAPQNPTTTGITSVQLQQQLPGKKIK